MRVLVIGGCGFIGSHLVDRLLAHGHAVRVFDRQGERYRQPLPGVEYLYGVMADRMAVGEALTGVDAVAHLVSTTVPSTADLDPRTDVQDNLLGTLALLDSMVSLGVGRILFLSSGGTVYGPPDLVPIPESHPLRPINSYGIVKAAIEHYLDMYRRTRGIAPVIVRASNPYGPRQAHTGVQGIISTYLSRLLAGESLEVWGDGSVVRDYLHVTDLAELCALAVASTRTGPYNAGSGQGTSVREIIEILRAVTGRAIEPIHKPGRLIDVQQSVLDPARARADFGWTCRVPLGEGIAATYDWMRAVAAPQD